MKKPDFQHVWGVVDKETGEVIKVVWFRHTARSVKTQAQTVKKFYLVEVK